MAGKLFIAFALNRSSSSFLNYSDAGYETWSPLWDLMSLPIGVYQNKGVATRSLLFLPPSRSSFNGFLNGPPPPGCVGMSYGPTAGAGNGDWLASGGPSRIIVQ